ncbi:uncharacterized protein F4812DRAFT_431161 [Daldinia caldariorum]|uniref:uncharacterized protein n=1 Tax=Daldinia caldariorum TaxID=326644 RepID=UPI002007C4FD|nr:uncharacterized protein F4812DRAFT_431161 [Daldinia caldariorum]KAI1467092.1 hypothetical protein F4812DRAFT_431161 [Daldinia caldariorum]
MAEPRVSQMSLSMMTSDQELSDWEAYDLYNSTWVPEITKVPVHWIDHILETSITARDQVLQPRKSSSDDKTKERLRKETAVYVFVPDKNDNNKPWPRKRYLDLETALRDLCARFKPHYSSVAAFTPETRKIQLFPPTFGMPENRCLIPGTIFFDIQDAVDNWYAKSPMEAPCGEENGTEAATATTEDLSSLNQPEIDLMNGYGEILSYDSDSMDVALSISDCDLPEPKMPGFAASKLGSSEESLMTDDYDMDIASRLGFIP